MRLLTLALATVLLPLRLLAGCAPVAGDFAPGTLDNSTNPPTLRPVGDCQVTVADAQALVQVALGAEQLAQPSSDVIVRGTVGGDGTLLGGTGFSVRYTAPGSGGTELPGRVSVVQNSVVVTAAAGQSPDFQNEVTAGQYLLIDGQFVVVDQVQSPNQLTLEQLYGGATNPSIAVTRDMTLFNSFAVSFDTPFIETPTVVVSAQGSSTKAGQMPAFNVMQLDVLGDGGPVDPGGFRAFWFQYPFGPYMPGGSTNWNFIAIGER